MDTTTSPIRLELSRLLDGKVDYEDFWEWLNAQKPLVTIGSPEQHLLYQIIGRFYEYDRGAWSDEQLHDLLVKLASEPVRRLA